MAPRRWVLPAVLLPLLIGLGGAVLYIVRELSPSNVRRVVQARLREEFPGANVRLGSAWIRPLGGISFADLTLSRSNDPDRAIFLHAPSGILFHDKEQLATEGRLAVRKVELHRPRLRVERSAGGHWNLAGVVNPGDPTRPVPTFVIHEGTLVIEDHLANLPPLEFHNVEATSVNDPVDRMIYQGHATGPLGELQLTGGWNRRNDRLELVTDLPAVPVGRALLDRLGRYAPDFATMAKHLQGMAALRLHLVHTPPKPDSSDNQPDDLSYDLAIGIRGGRYTHANLPMPIEDLELGVRLKNGQLSIDRLAGRMGQAQLTAQADFRPPHNPQDVPRRVDWLPAQLTSLRRPLAQLPWPPAEPSPPPAQLQDWEAQVRRADVTLKQLELTEDFVSQLPGQYHKLERMIQPRGLVGLRYQLDHAGRDWAKQLTITPQGAAGIYEKFPYPLTNIQGTIDLQASRGQPESMTIDLTAQAQGQMVSLRGRVQGEHGHPAMALDVRAEGVPLDETLVAALPTRYQPLARSFHPRGRGDLIATIRSAHGQTTTENHFQVRIRDASVSYDVFPYPLEQVSGLLEIHSGETSSWEFKEFVGLHEGGVVKGSGRGFPTPYGDGLVVELTGQSVPLDAAMGGALEPLGLQSVWHILQPEGRIQFSARVVQTPRPRRPLPSPEDRALGGDDLEVVFSLAGASVKPTFFPYRLTDLAASVQSLNDTVVVRGFQARHGPSLVSAARADVIKKPAGGVWANVLDLRLNPLACDGEFVAALPESLQEAVREVDLRGSLGLSIKQLVVDQPTARPTEIAGALPGGMVRSRGSGRDLEETVPPVIYWDGALQMRNVSFRTGLEWTGTAGEIACRGRHNGMRLEAVRGNVLLESAQLLGQPITRLHARFDDDPDAPEVLRLYPHAGLYGGDMGGEVRLTTGSQARYDLKLTATGIDLEALARHNQLQSDAKMSGLAGGQIWLTGRAHPKPGEPMLEGGGSVDVESGQMYNLPLLLDVLKVLNLRAPDRTAFEEMHARFLLRDQRVSVSQLDLLGNAINLRGRGELDTNGENVAFSFHTMYSRVADLMPAPLHQLSSTVSRGLYQIRVTGSLAGGGGKGLTFRQVPVPVLVEPIKQRLERIRQ